MIRSRNSGEKKYSRLNIRGKADCLWLRPPNNQLRFSKVAHGHLINILFAANFNRYFIAR